MRAECYFLWRNVKKCKKSLFRVVVQLLTSSKSLLDMAEHNILSQPRIHESSDNNVTNCNCSENKDLDSQSQSLDAMAGGSTTVDDADCRDDVDIVAKSGSGMLDTVQTGILT